MCSSISFVILFTLAVPLSKVHAGKEYKIPNGKAILKQTFIATNSLDHELVHWRLERRQKRLALWLSSLNGIKASEWSAGSQRTQETEMWTIFLQILFFQKPWAKISFAGVKLWHPGHLWDWTRGWLQGKMDQIHTISIHNLYSLNNLNT